MHRRDLLRLGLGASAFLATASLVAAAPRHQPVVIKCYAPMTCHC